MTPMKTPIILTKPTADRVIIIILFCTASLVTTGFEDTKKKLSTESTTCFELVYYFGVTSTLHLDVQCSQLATSQLRIMVYI